MRAGEYLAFFGRIYGLPPEVVAGRAGDLLDRIGMPDVLERRLGEFSKGMRQKLALVRAMIHQPVALLLDEPTSAMDPASARLVRESIVRLRSSQCAIVVTTHNLAEADILADRIAIIREGKIAALGTVDELKRRFVGEPIMELRLAGGLDGALRHLPPDLVPLATGADWIRYHAAQPERVNPAVLAAMAQAGVGVVLLSEVHRSLEDVYLRAVGVSTPDLQD
jgi:ABC-2 type transport system ATP-binding protein